VTKSPFTNVHDVKEIAHRAFANVTDDEVKRCIAHTKDQEDFYRYLHKMEPLTVEPIEEADMQSDSESIEQDDNDLELEILADSHMAQQEPIVGSLVLNEQVHQDPIGGSLVLNEQAQQEPIGGLVSNEQAQQEPIRGLVLNEQAQHDPIGGSLVLNEARHALGSSEESDVEYIETSVELHYHTCTMCDFKSPSKAKLAFHLKTHFICKICGKMFHGNQGKRDYKRHLKKHQTPFDYKCSGCDKTFSESWLLNRHIKEVHNSLPKDTYSCSKCNQTFKFKSYLNRHLQSDNCSKKKVYTCIICNTSFSFPSKLKRHMQQKHASNARKKLDFKLDTDTASAKLPVVSNDQSDSQSEKDLTANPTPLIGEVYTCLKCDKSFSSNLFLNGHMIRKHDPNFTLDT